MQEYIKTDQYLHVLSQVIAKANRAYVPSKEDDSHTNLYYDPLNERITGRWIPGPDGNVLLVLDLRNQRFEWLDHTLHPVHSVPAMNSSMKSMEKGVGAFLSSLGLETENFYKKLHFGIPDYQIRSFGPEEITGTGLEQWKYYRRLANEACLGLTGMVQVQEEIRIWPHHFDTGIYVPVNQELGLGFGLAMADTLAGQPYFYMAAYRTKGSMVYEGLPRLSYGRWITGEEGWKGAILGLEELPFQSRDEAMARTEGFIREAAGWMLTQEGS